MVDRRRNSGTAVSKGIEPKTIKETLDTLPLIQLAKKRREMTDEQKAAYDLACKEELAAQDERIRQRMIEQEARRRRCLVQIIAQQVGPRYCPERVSIESFILTDPNCQTPVLKRLREIAGSLDKFSHDGSGLIFFGSVGTGKDHLAIAMLYHGAKEFGLDGYWVNGRAMFQASRDAIACDKRESELLKPLVKPSILCISDPVPLSGSLSAWNIDLLYRVVEERYRDRKPTWLTVNCRDSAEADQRLTAPVWDRLQDRAEIVNCFWASFRSKLTFGQSDRR